MKQELGPGRHVHYHEAEREYPLAAIITHPGDGKAVNLAVFNANGSTHGMVDVPYSFDPKPGHWSWPPHIREAIAQAR